MKTKNLLWAALSMTAALVMTACSNDDNDMTEAPVAPSTSKTIPYTVTVGGDEATTRANIVEPDHRTLYFASGDKLYITGTNIKGVLEIQDGIGNATGATFSGVLTYSGEGSPADNLQLTATLVSAQQTVGTQVSVNAAGAVTVNYPTTAYCSSINDAVQEYSRLTGTSTYGARAFTLTQHTAFLNFVITFEDATTTGTELTAVVNNNSSNICTANVTTTTESEKVVAKFVLPVAAGTTLSSANVKMGSKAALAISDATLTGKVYNVKKTQYKMAAAATNADKGKLICTDGHIHAYNADAECTATRVAKIAYVGSDAETSTTYNHGLALALSDVSGYQAWCSQTANTCLPTQYNSESAAKADMAGLANTDALVGHASHTHNAASAARNYNSGTHPTGTSAWFLPSAGQWDKMATTAGGYNNLGLESYSYWSSSERYASSAWYFISGNGNWGGGNKGNVYLVRACLAF